MFYNKPTVICVQFIRLVVAAIQEWDFCSLVHQTRRDKETIGSVFYSEAYEPKAFLVNNVESDGRPSLHY